MFVQEMSEPHNHSRMSKVKKMTLAVQGTIVGALLMSIVWLVPYIPYDYYHHYGNSRSIIIKKKI